MPARLKLIVAYDGAPFAGWQSQAHGNTVQDHLERALAAIAGTPVRVHGAGRTDAGVHALGQCAHADVANKSIAVGSWLAALNGALPAAIRVLRCRYVTDAFHARFSAKGKVYRYRIWHGPVLPPFEHGRAWHVSQPINLETIVAAARLFEGTHDFAGFAANRGTPPETTVRTVRSVRVRRAAAIISVEVDGDGFLYKMVRLMVGELVRIGRGVSDCDQLGRRLAAPSGSVTRHRFVAPAEGLILVRVRY
jgi:tRNA pseudouridine38-40 synthase